MKTKLTILSVAVLAIISGAVIAGNTSTSTWKQELLQVQMPPNENPASPLVITKDLSALRGRGFFYVESGSLHKEEVSVNGVLATSSQQVATGAIRLVDQNENSILFLKDLSVPTEGINGYKNELWLLDKRTGAAHKVADNVTQEGSLSPSDELIVVRSTDNELLVFTYNGGLVTKVGGYGVSPVFSPSGDKIAYIKLKNKRPEMGDPEMFQGVAVYDLGAQKDTLIFRTAPNRNEWMIAGWSADGKRIYFPSADSTWSVGVDGTSERQETNKTKGMPRVPMFLSHLLFTDDGTVAFGEAEGLWAFRLGKDGEFLDARKVVEGTPGYSSRLDWLEKGKSVATRLYGNISTTVFRVSDLNQ